MGHFTKSRHCRVRNLFYYKKFYLEHETPLEAIFLANPVYASGRNLSMIFVKQINLLIDFC